MGNRIKVRTPRGIRSILTMSQADIDLLISTGSGAISPYSESTALTASSKLITHSRGKLCEKAFYYDDSGWVQTLGVNNDNTGNDLNATWVYAGKIITLRKIYLTFITE